MNLLLKPALKTNIVDCLFISSKVHSGQIFKKESVYAAENNSLYSRAQIGQERGSTGSQSHLLVVNELTRNILT